MNLLYVALGAAIGAPTRYLVDRAVSARHGSIWPWGTLIVNVVGSFLLGLLLASGVDSGAGYALLGAGFCGALTTFSTFAYESEQLLSDGAAPVALGNIALTLLLGLGAAALGWTLGGT